MICGGTIDGNCASGRPRIATSPAITVTIEITIATMGRSIKNFEITNYSLKRAKPGNSGILPVWSINMRLFINQLDHSREKDRQDACASGAFKSNGSLV